MKDYRWHNHRKKIIELTIVTGNSVLKLTYSIVLVTDWHVL